MTERRVAKRNGFERCSRPVPISSHIAFPLLSKLVSQFVTLTPDSFIELGTGKLEVKSNTGAVGACCRTFFGGRGMSSWYFVLFSNLCRETCFCLRRPTFQRFFLMSYGDFYSCEDRLSLSFNSDIMFKFHTVNTSFLRS